ncbi:MULTISPECIES: sialidase family protein [unclassified Paraburkholderia]|uniref:sialidase family protein n=1 Tax=unclassified Paraburkholderia TaxID=2615204 RepID=UPI0034CE364A
MLVSVLCACGVAASAKGRTNVGPPGRVIAHSAASTHVFLGSPALAVLPDGTYVASYDTFGPGSSEDYVTVMASRDKGQSWTRQSTVSGQYWSSLFVLDNALYLMGTDRAMGTPTIRRSVDGGATWTDATDASTGRFNLPGRYITGAVPVVVSQGRVWRAYDVVEGGDLRSLVMSAPQHSNLLDTQNWTVSKHQASNPAWLRGKFISWEEGSVVLFKNGPPGILLRVNTRNGVEKAAIVHGGSDETTLSFDPTRDFVDMPGGGKKFTVRFDPTSQRYWSLTNAVLANDGHESLERVRNTLALISSPDLHNWSVSSVVMRHPDVKRHGFQYVDWEFSGDDIIAVIRTSFDDPEGGAQSQHNSNYITFARFPDFRRDAH